jgi:hypothetical protein
MNESTAAVPPGFFLEEPPLSPTPTEQSSPFEAAGSRLLEPGERILHGRNGRHAAFEHGWMADRIAAAHAQAVEAAEPAAPHLEVVSATPDPAPSVAALYLRLTSGERIIVGSYPTADQADFEARMLSLRMGRDGEWIPVEGRYVRPEAVVSVDVETLGA